MKQSQTIFVLLLLFILAGIIALLAWQFRPAMQEVRDGTTVIPSASSPTPITTGCDENTGESFTSSRYNVTFRYPCSAKKATVTESTLSSCIGETKSEIISFSGSSINIDVNQCSIPHTAQEIEKYTLTSKDGKTFTVYILGDVFTPSLRHFKVEGTDKLQMRANSINTNDVGKVKADIKFIVESLEFTIE